jgi:hypothetical protein
MDASTRGSLTRLRLLLLEDITAPQRGQRPHFDEGLANSIDKAIRQASRGKASEETVRLLVELEGTWDDPVQRAAMLEKVRAHLPKPAKRRKGKSDDDDYIENPLFPRSRPHTPRIEVLGATHNGQQTAPEPPAVEPDVVVEAPEMPEKVEAPPAPVATPADPLKITVGARTFTILFPDLVRPLSTDETERLRASIRARGIEDRVVVDEHDGIIDGINRLRIAAELGLKEEEIRLDVYRSCESQHTPDLVREDKRDLALTLNLDRRQLSPVEQQRLQEERNARILAKRKEGKSYRDIGEEEGISHQQVKRIVDDRATVTGVTVEPEGGKVRGKDGKARPATRAKPKVRKPIPEAEPVADEPDVIIEPPSSRQKTLDECIREATAVVTVPDTLEDTHDAERFLAEGLPGFPPLRDFVGQLRRLKAFFGELQTIEEIKQLVPLADEIQQLNEAFRNALNEVYKGSKRTN